MNHARLGIIDAAALVARARAADWPAVEMLAGEILAGDHTREVLELLSRLVAGCLSDLAAADGEDEDDVFDTWIAAAVDAVGDIR